MKHLGVLLFPILALVLVAAALLAPSGADERRRPTSVPVTQSSYACPAGPTITNASGQVRPGSGSTARVLPSKDRDPSLEDAGAWRTSVVDGSGVVVQQQGRSSGASGFFAGKADASGGGGLVVGSCPGVVDDSWMLGLGSGDKHFSTLILTNLADSTAAVDLELWGPDGPIDAVGAEGIVVKPSSVRRIKLDDIAAGEPTLALHVHRRRGSLSAVVNDTSTAEFSGTEPVTATAPPRRRQVIGGVVEGASGRTLTLLNPGGSTARVDVEVLGPKNTFRPSGLDQIKVAAGSVKEITVPRSAGSGRQALRLTSDRPVSGGVRMEPSTSDYAFAESVPPLTGPAIVPVELGSATGTPELVLTAPGEDASAQVQAFDESMRPVDSASVDIPAGTTTSFDAGKELDGDVAYLVLRPEGEVVAAATYTGNGGISSLALTDAPVTVLSPQVRPAS